MRRSLSFLAIALGSLVTDASAHSTTGATVLDRGGCFRHTGREQCVPAAHGARVPAQATYVAGPSGGRIRLVDGSVLSLEAGAELEVLPPTRLILGHDSGVPGQSVRLQRGLADVQVAKPKNGKSAVLVGGPRALGGIVSRGLSTIRTTGTRFFVANGDGDVLAGSGSEWRDVPPGKMRVFAGGEAEGALRAMPEAPMPHCSTRLLLETGTQSTKPIEVTWDAVADASQYELAVQGPSHAEPLRLQFGAETTSTKLADHFAPGTFTASVRSFDRDAMPSRWAPAIAVTVLQASLPVGGRVVDDGALQILPHQKVSLVGLEGMEMAYGDRWVPAPTGNVGLLNGVAQTVRIRRHGEAEELSIRVEPRSVNATVQITPRNPVWPGKNLEIRIRLEDAKGGGAASDIELHPRVLLDVTPVDVAWTIEGGVLRGTVASRDSGGRPHVVRVEVDDQHGLEIGRGFVEVGAAKAVASR